MEGLVEALGLSFRGTNEQVMYASDVLQSSMGTPEFMDAMFTVAFDENEGSALREAAYIQLTKSFQCLSSHPFSDIHSLFDELCLHITPESACFVRYWRRMFYAAISSATRSDSVQVLLQNLEYPTLSSLVLLDCLCMTFKSSIVDIPLDFFGLLRGIDETLCPVLWLRALRRLTECGYRNNPFVQDQVDVILNSLIKDESFLLESLKFLSSATPTERLPELLMFMLNHHLSNWSSRVVNAGFFALKRLFEVDSPELICQVYTDFVFPSCSSFILLETCLDDRKYGLTNLPLSTKDNPVASGVYITKELASKQRFSEEIYGFLFEKMKMNETLLSAMVLFTGSINYLSLQFNYSHFFEFLSLIVQNSDSVSIASVLLVASAKFPFQLPPFFLDFAFACLNFPNEAVQEIALAAIGELYSPSSLDAELELSCIPIISSNSPSRAHLEALEVIVSKLQNCPQELFHFLISMHSVIASSHDPEVSINEYKVVNLMQQSIAEGQNEIIFESVRYAMSHLTRNLVYFVCTAVKKMTIFPKKFLERVVEKLWNSIDDKEIYSEDIIASFVDLSNISINPSLEHFYEWFLDFCVHQMNACYENGQWGTWADFSSIVGNLIPHCQNIPVQTIAQLIEYLTQDPDEFPWDAVENMAYAFLSRWPSLVTEFPFSVTKSILATIQKPDICSMIHTLIPYTMEEDARQLRELAEFRHFL